MAEIPHISHSRLSLGKEYTNKKAYGRSEEQDCRMKGGIYVTKMEIAYR